MKELVPFQFEGNQVQVITDEKGDPWFVAKDVCDVLGLANITEAVRGLDDDEKQQLATNIINPEVGGRGTIIINEPGLYGLILRSRKPEARAFKRWITQEVFSSILKSGGISTPPESIVG